MNAIRHILMHVDSSDQVLGRLAVCKALAERFGAKVTALYAVTPWLLQYPVLLDAGGVATQLSDWDEERRQAAHERVTKAMAGDDALRWAQLEDQSPFDFANEALYADLMVLGRRDQDGPSKDDVPADFLAHAILHSGKPALVLPADTSFTRAPKVVLVAWNGSRESARALTAAMPFMHEAQAVHVLHVRTGAHDDGGLDALAFQLRAHGVEAVFHSAVGRADDAGPLLLDMARDLKADLIVMGCYGHSRAREWVLGGTTRTMLSKAPLPVLMAH
jgi:nucleotide-binding universal stress UspA family protein